MDVDEETNFAKTNDIIHEPSQERSTSDEPSEIIKPPEEVVSDTEPGEPSNSPVPIRQEQEESVGFENDLTTGSSTSSAEQTEKHTSNETGTVTANGKYILSR